ncbi:MAG: class I SAM-dependent methyltransferase [Candidatus Bathyarchaeia archaeon]
MRKWFSDVTLTLRESLKPEKDELVPPMKLRHIIGLDNFKVDRAEMLAKNLDLRNVNSILDVGCGCGSLSYSLIRYHNFQGKYEGFDIIKDFIDWLQQHYTTKYPNFHFTFAPLSNNNYVRGGESAGAYTFPYPNGMFDAVFLGSVFTHMLPADLEHYLSEIVRVMKSHGTSFISYFFESGRRKDFIRVGQYSTRNPKCPEEAIAYDENFILRLYENVGLRATRPVIYGAQDWIIAEKV